MTEQAGEIQEIMGRSYGMPELDEDDLEAELDALGDEIALDDDMSYLDEASKAPSAPTGVPGAASEPASQVGPTNYSFSPLPIVSLSGVDHHDCLSPCFSVHYCCLFSLNCHTMRNYSIRY